MGLIMRNNKEKEVTLLISNQFIIFFKTYLRMVPEKSPVKGIILILT